MKRNYWILVAACLIPVIAGCQQQATTNSSEKERQTMTKARSEQTNEPISSTQESISDTTAHFAAGSLLEAVSNNNLVSVQAILKSSDYPINETNNQGESPLLIATHKNYIEIAKALIDAGADINQQDHLSDSSYLYASAQGKTEILKYMLDKSNPDQQKVNRFGGNALIPAAEKGHLANVKLLLQDGQVNINHQNNYGYTALIEAVALRDGSSVYQEIITELLNAGADKSLRDNTGTTAEDYAKSLGYSEMQEILAAY
ncbi:ankyrin repeat domain-containing protein [Enterococcus sp. UD-01]|jgi:ankyrin repeat protein|uniref:ankyrin repeat domain-containing protein n=1 Tax=Enterococcus sp. UD-01 TaxID=3373911 RepID=UPI003832BD8F